jgi:predicted nucleic acid-binding protein
MPTTPTAVLDACVLYPAPLRDLLMELALRDLFRARWTAEIHDEWMRNLRLQRPDLDPTRLERTRELMDLHVRDALVTGHQSLISALTLPDPDDRHVLAAAIRCDADVIVTKNLKDFPADILGGYGIEAQHHDDFVMELLHAQEGLVCSAVRTVHHRLRNPPKTAQEYLLTLEQQELTQTVNRLRDLIDLI